GFVGASASTRTEPRLDGRSPSDLSDDDVDMLLCSHNVLFPLSQTEEEIQTLRQVLLAKEKYASDVRRQLGLSPLSTMKQNLSRGWQDVQSSAPYVRTRDNLSHAGQVTSAALSNVGVAFTRRLAEMR
uniref:Tpd52 like 2a n=1 Tax=Scophthalmus maximus TaxID=52904 RepID=A0A8D3ARZ6_SCOMX